MDESTGEVAAGGRLSGRVAIVTGAGMASEDSEVLGTGAAIGVLLAREGARVGLIDRDEGHAERTHSRIQAEGGKSVVVVADVTDERSCCSAVTTVVDRWGQLDVLVNNVGISSAGVATDLDLDAWEKVFRTNVTSMMLMARESIPHMQRAGAGAIINLSSVSGIRGGHSGLAYPTSKGAVVNMTRAMAAHHGSVGIRVNCVAPGMIYTPMVGSRGMTPDVREQRRRSSLLETEGTAWDVAYAVAFLASQEARWITGVTLPVDAGRSAVAGGTVAGGQMQT